MKVKVETIWPDSRNDEDVAKALNALGASRVVSVEPFGDYEYRVIYEVEE